MEIFFLQMGLSSLINKLGLKKNPEAFHLLSMTSDLLIWILLSFESSQFVVLPRLWIKIAVQAWIIEQIQILILILLFIHRLVFSCDDARKSLFAPLELFKPYIYNMCISNSNQLCLHGWKMYKCKMCIVFSLYSTSMPDMNKGLLYQLLLE